LFADSVESMSVALAARFPKLEADFLLNVEEDSLPLLPQTPPPSTVVKSEEVGALVPHLRSLDSQEWEDIGELSLDCASRRPCAFYDSESLMLSILTQFELPSAPLPSPFNALPSAPLPFNASLPLPAAPLPFNASLPLPAAPLPFNASLPLPAAPLPFNASLPLPFNALPAAPMPFNAPLTSAPPPVPNDIGFDTCALAPPAPSILASPTLAETRKRKRKMLKKKDLDSVKEEDEDEYEEANDNQNHDDDDYESSSSFPSKRRRRHASRAPVAAADVVFNPSDGISESSVARRDLLVAIDQLQKRIDAKEATDPSVELDRLISQLV
jgi:hypothetical protein